MKYISSLNVWMLRETFWSNLWEQNGHKTLKPGEIKELTLKLSKSIEWT